MTRARKWLLGTGIAAGTLFAVVALLVAWLLYTPSGLRFVLDRGAAMTDGQFGYASATGTLAGEVVISGLHYRDEDGTSVRIERAAVDLQPWELLANRLHVRTARIDGIDVSLAPSTQPTESGGFALRPPIDVVLDDTLLTRITVRDGNASLYEADSFAIAGRWTRNRIELTRMALRARAGNADLEGKLEFTQGYNGEGRATLDWTYQGTRYAAEFTTHSANGQATLQATVTSPIKAQLDATYAIRGRAWTINLHVPQFDRRTVPALPASIKAVAMDLQGSGNARSGMFTGNIIVDGHDVVVDPLAFRFDGKTLTLDPVRVRARNSDGAATVTGVVDLRGGPVRASLHADWHDVELPADLVGQTLATHGEVQIEGGAAQFMVKGALSIGPPGRLSDLQLDLAGTTQAITINALKLVQEGGGLSARGQVELKPHAAWQLEATAERFDPGAILAGWDGAMDFNLATHGTITPKGPEVVVKLTDTDGTLRGRSIAGSEADVRISPGNLLDGSLRLVTGNSRIEARGTRGARTNAVIDVDVASLGDWFPGASGKLRGQFSVAGAWPALAIAGQLRGTALIHGGHRIDNLQLNGSIPDVSKPGGDIDLALSGVRLAGGVELDSVRLVGRGTAAAHRFEFNANGKQLRAGATLQGRWQATTRRWSGTLDNLELAPQGMPTWRQQQPSTVSWQNGVATLGELCLSPGTPRACISGSRDARGAITLAYTLADLPLQTLVAMAPGADPLQASGEISGSGQIKREVNGTLGGQANLAVSEGRIAFASNPEQSLLAWSAITANAGAANGNRRLALNAALAEGGHVKVDLDVRGGTRSLDGNIDINLRNLAVLGAVSPGIANVKGSLVGNLVLGGTATAPRFSGRIQTAGFSAELPAAGLVLHDGAFAIAGDDQGQLQITGELGSGQGVLHIDGNMGLGSNAPLAFTFRGDNVLVADIPAAHVVASPDLKLARSDGLLTLTGSVAIPSARAQLDKLRGEATGQGGVQASPDIVVVDEPQPEPAESMALHANVTVTLGDDVRLQGFGLDGRAQGRLTVEARPGRAATGRGQVAVLGTFQGFGQNLSIERGQLLFADTPLDNPGLDIRAVRHIRNQDVTVGVAIRGTARAPVLSVFSTPAMQQSEALAYLVTGQPLGSLTSDQGSNVSAAAQALGGVLGNRIAGNVGARMGLQLGVSGSEALGGSAFTVGRYLSPRLFLSYGTGLFVPGQVVTVRFLINSFLNFEAENATTGNRASLNYRIER